MTISFPDPHYILTLLRTQSNLKDSRLDKPDHILFLKCCDSWNRLYLSDNDALPGIRSIF